MLRMLNVATVMRLLALALASMVSADALATIAPTMARMAAMALGLLALALLLIGPTMARMAAMALGLIVLMLAPLMVPADAISTIAVALALMAAMCLGLITLALLLIGPAASTPTFAPTTAHMAAPALGLLALALALMAPADALSLALMVPEDMLALMAATALGLIALALALMGPTELRRWANETEGIAGSTNRYNTVVWDQLITRAGGIETVLLKLRDLSELGLSSMDLLPHLQTIFLLDDDEFRLVCIAFWLVYGGAAVEHETSVMGGLFMLHGTHMRSWETLYDMLRHDVITGEWAWAGKVSRRKVHALCMIAFLTCGPEAHRRICRQARKMCFRFGIFRMWEVLYPELDVTGVLMRESITKNACDTSNMFIRKKSGARYTVYQNILGGSPTRTRALATFPTFQGAAEYVVELEQPLREDYIASMDWTARMILEAHDLLPTRENLLESDMYQPCAADQGFATRQELAQSRPYGGDNPYSARINNQRGYANARREAEDA